MSPQWDRFNRYFLRYPDLHFSLDISRVHFEEGYFDTMRTPAAKAFKLMEGLEKGEIANPDEKRMVVLTHLVSNRPGFSRHLGDSPAQDRFEWKK